jgi:hypothetical protein
LATLFAAVAACVSGPALSLTAVGRRFGGAVGLGHNIKRADRLLGNRHLHREAKSIDQALCRVTPARVREPLILIDWSDPKADQSLHLLRASLPVGGRSLTLYEEVHPQRKLNNAAVHARVLHHLSTLMPPGAAPIIIADAGFKVPFHRELQALGRRWVGRVSGRDFARLQSRWSSCKTLFKRATATPTALGEGEWVRSNPMRAVFALVRRAPKGRRGKTAFGRRARSKASTQNARSAKEPWLLVASTRFAAWPAKRLVRLYALIVHRGPETKDPAPDIRPGSIMVVHVLNISGQGQPFSGDEAVINLADPSAFQGRLIRRGGYQPSLLR